MNILGEILLRKVTDRNTNQEYTITNKCPNCNQFVGFQLCDQTLIKEQAANIFNIRLNRLECRDCGEILFNINGYDEFDEEIKLLFTSQKLDIGEGNKIFTDHDLFQKLYNQACYSEIIGEKELAVVGYQKSLDILIMESAINRHSNKKDKIQQLSTEERLSEFFTEIYSLTSEKILNLINMSLSNDLDNLCKELKNYIKFILLYHHLKSEKEKDDLDALLDDIDFSKLKL